MMGLERCSSINMSMCSRIVEHFKSSMQFFHNGRRISCFFSVTVTRQKGSAALHTCKGTEQVWTRRAFEANKQTLEVATSELLRNAVQTHFLETSQSKEEGRRHMTGLNSATQR